MRESVLFQSAEKLRTDLIADGEKKKQKENRFDRSVDGDVELSDKDSYQQYACYNSQAELSDFDFSNPKAHKKGQEDSQLGVYPKLMYNPIHS